MGNDKNTMLVPPDTSWFDENPEKYLSRDDFRRFQKVSGVELRNLVSEDKDVVRKAQEEIVAQTRVLNEIRNQHGGYGMPLLYYTHDLKLGKKIPSKMLNWKR